MDHLKPAIFKLFKRTNPDFGRVGKAAVDRDLAHIDARKPSIKGVITPMFSLHLAIADQHVFGAALLMPVGCSQNSSPSLAAMLSSISVTTPSSS